MTNNIAGRISKYIIAHIIANIDPIPVGSIAPNP